MEGPWSSEAFRDLERIFVRIHKENPEAAGENTLYEGCTALRDFPNRGRLGRMRGRRELVFPPLPYIVVYQVKEKAVEISRIYHAAQDWH